ncbi:MAG TPA: hypothetical protein VL688_06750 [Verrucomicrobiae bacterium]|nr:hypothetical protein [Verrucomicrobiae bacterium]
MRTNLKMIALLAAGLLIGQQAAFSEMVQGQVTAVNQANNSLKVQMMQPGGEKKEVELNIPQQGEFRGIQSLADVEVGDQIRAEANKPALGIGSWEAKWIEKSAAQASQTQGAQSQGLQSQSSQSSFGGNPSAGAQQAGTPARNAGGSLSSETGTTGTQGRSY